MLTTLAILTANVVADANSAATYGELALLVVACVCTPLLILAVIGIHRMSYTLQRVSDAVFNETNGLQKTVSRLAHSSTEHDTQLKVIAVQMEQVSTELERTRD